MENKLSFTQRITVYGLGAALFVVVGCALPIPIPNTTAHIDLGYAIVAIFGYLFGPIAGLLVGGLGRFLEDMILYGSIGSPGWLIASICIGFLTGILSKLRHKKINSVVSTIVIIVGILIVNAVFLIGFAPFISSLWNGVPFVAKLPSGISAFITNSVSMLALGIPVAKILEKPVKKLFSK
ncbi:MAG: ECF transporter S component [Clostridia bacterium]|nr:ECF transporter S component [Clostridia bacterium]